MLSKQIKSLAERYLDHCNTLDSRYKLLHKLGEGRFGKVYLALDLGNNELVAIKILRGACFRHQLVNFFSEIKHLVFLLDRICCEEQLKAIRILDFNFEGRLNDCKSVAYYTMEYIELGEFYSFIEKSDFLSEDLARSFVKQLLSTIKLLHSHNVFHLDIKPENVLINERGELYLCDFGNALCYKRPKGIHWKNINFVGSMEYAAPEAYELDIVKELNGAHDYIGSYDIGKLDIFSLGVLTFVLVVKSQPFGKAHDDDPFYKRLTTSKADFWKIFEGLRSSSNDFKEVVEHMMEPVSFERVNLDELIERKWLLGGSNKNGTKQELGTLLEQRKQAFVKELLVSLEGRLTKRKQAMSNSKSYRYKDGEEMLKKFLIKNEKKLSKLKYKIDHHRKSTSGPAPVLESNTSADSSDNDIKF